MSAGVGGGTVLAILCKENGILLPLLAVLVEGLFLRRRVPWPRGRGKWVWSGLFLGSPLLFLSGYAVWSWDAWVTGYRLRPFTMAERLLTEARVVWDYLFGILQPRVFGTGLFHDDYVISRSLWEPVSTFWAVAGIGVLLAAIPFLWRRHPWVAFGVAWFFTGQLLESTVIPLELYFEHRNYLPMVGPLFILVHLLGRVPQRLQRLARVVLLLLVAACGAMTHQAALVWGDLDLLAQISVIESPDSIRARQFVADRWSRKGHLAEALAHLTAVGDRHREAMGLRLERLQLLCLMGRLERAEVLEVTRLMPASVYDRGATTGTLRVLRGLVDEARCPAALGMQEYAALVEAALANPGFQRDGLQLGDLYGLQASLALARKDLNGAMAALDQAALYLPGSVDIPLMQAAWLATAGLFDEALGYIGRARTIDERWGGLYRVRAADIAAMERLIRQDRESRAPSGGGREAVPSPSTKPLGEGGDSG
ncbi:MAG: hypothetical protein HQL57_05315 [Magnetococcales bacterium]|nr:hypothetical protein [Magnetococcales bacterium]